MRHSGSQAFPVRVQTRDLHAHAAIRWSTSADTDQCTLVPTGILVLNAREGGPAFKAGLMGTSRDEYGRLVLVSE